MNEQIKLLAKQAGFFPELNYDHTQWHAAGYNPNFEKLAELIVRECADICNRIYFDRYPDAEDFERSEEGDAIKKHFGVEQ